MDGRNQGGANCASCHKGDEFGIDRNSNNNGVIIMRLISTEIQTLI